MSDTELMIGGARTPAEVMGQRHLLEEIYRSVMIPGIDYGLIPGTKERALLKPGAEVLRLGFNFEVEMSMSKEVDLSVGWVNIDARCSLKDSEGRVVGQADANANSYESKFHYRWLSEKQMPSYIDKDSLITRQMSGAYGSYTQYRVETEDVGGLIHTLTRYAEKRAFVAAIHQATGASRIFREADEDEVEKASKPMPAKGRPKQTSAKSVDSSPEAEGAKESTAPTPESAHSDDIEGQHGPVPPPRAFKNLQECLGAVNETFGVSATEVLNSLGVKSPTELTKTPAELWAYCAGSYKPKDS